MSEISNHFNKIASDYDTWKKRNWYYYQNLKKLIQEHIPSQKTVLEIGTGTGDILASLNPILGVGIDISDEMIKLAKGKYDDYKNLQFFCTSFNELKSNNSFDYIILIDVVEHLEDIQGMVQQIKNKVTKQTEIFISMANPVWEPILQLLEKLKLKMPEGKHYRMSSKKLKEIFYKQGFRIKKHNFALLIPVYIPFISDIVNCWFFKIPVLRKLGLIEYLVFIK